ncbi:MULTISPECIES: hypothetical protein [Oceanobacillus]|uniref:Uncharacterized protein n=1 Tax=Oceanobacillus aidingensis TaxID=645964 RepID=A0ABV9JXV6_9BACI|nr:hypothetical protein [Oceanobacillus oncorhynchi]MDM8100662.1 hypothetical protein [Oceanobacillus oncorhynchi]UUI41477.1 hypothetical protein NP440_08040 [Oceanobacillus oncorhynchi]
MKKYLVFAGVFCVSFLVLQVAAGMIWTLLYTPDISAAWQQAGALSSETALIKASAASPFIIAVTSLAVTFGLTRLVRKRIAM